MPLGHLTTNINATAAAAAACTLTLPTPAAGKRHQILLLEITAYSTAARTGGATPVIVTTTNLGGLAWRLQSAAAVGTKEVITLVGDAVAPITAAVEALATTIVCPATTSIIWNVNCIYTAA